MQKLVTIGMKLIKIGITGGIASGKSTLVNLIKKMGYEVIDADLIAFDLMRPGEVNYMEILEEFGRDILENPLDDRSQVDRQKLAHLIFTSGENLEKINKITHENIYEEIEKRLGDKESKSKDKNLVFVDIPLLFEAKINEGLYIDLDEIWLVYLDEETQIKRLMIRDGINREYALNKIRSQLPLKEKRKLVDRILINDGNIEKLKESLVKEMARIDEKYGLNQEDNINLGDGKYKNSDREALGRESKDQVDRASFNEANLSNEGSKYDLKGGLDKKDTMSKSSRINAEDVLNLESSLGGRKASLRDGKSKEEKGKMQRKKGKNEKGHHPVRSFFVKLFSIILAIAIILLGISFGITYYATSRLDIKYTDLIENYSKKNKLDSKLTAALISVESSYNEKAKSGVGARGLMQILPETAEWISEKMKVDYDKEKLFDPEYNIKMGTFYLKYLLDYFKSEHLALAAYNGGMGNVEKWIKEGKLSAAKDSLENIPFEETRNYVGKIDKKRELIDLFYPEKLPKGNENKFSLAIENYKKFLKRVLKDF